ncbi:MAG: glycosyltransferase [Actinobacteria bacterium]|uniref:Unannotated protein n=1 Tax=freshwater metagenome TaxID=449393 RepID=A0A6J7G841_9ZZZZ|nr:glycosyltransferase [Actinomycetota bacterium]
MKVLHVSTYDGNGGAGRAAFALHQAMAAAGIDSNMLVAQKSSSDPRVTELQGRHKFTWKAAQFADRKMWDLQKSQNKTWRSPARFGALSADVINASDADVVNLHWVTNGFLSIKEIGRISKPIVWSLYDMWTFSGTEHYGADSLDARWRSGYTPSNRVAGDSGFDLDRATWNRKKKFWKQPMHLVPASSWLADRAAHSEIAHSWPITRIAHVIDTNIFSPMDRSLARARHSLPTGVPLVLFLSSAGIADHRKGWELLETAMTQVKSAFPLVELFVAGPATPDYTHLDGIPITWIGQVEGDEALQSLYAAANVVAVPSKEDNMPLTAMEAQSVGVSVAAFSIGGLPDIVLDGVTGSLAPAFDVSALAAGIVDSLGAAGVSQGLAARSHAIETWSPKVVVESYLEVYQQEIALASKN